MKKTKIAGRTDHKTRSLIRRRHFLFAAGTGAAMTVAAGASNVENAVAADSERAESFKEVVTRMLNEIDELTREGGPIQNQLVALNERLAALSATVDTCNNAIGDHNDIRAVKRTLDEICRALHINCPLPPNE